jgi:hypothetical protein
MCRTWKVYFPLDIDTHYKVNSTTPRSQSTAKMLETKPAHVYRFTEAENEEKVSERKEKI